MKRIFDDAVNPSEIADRQHKALEQKIIMASKGADGDDSVAGGYKAKGAAKTGASVISGKKKAADTYLDIVTLQDQISSNLNALNTDIRRLSDELHKTDLRMAERQQTIDFITQNIHDVDDLRDASGEWTPRVKALLKEQGKDHVSDADALVFIQSTLTVQLIEEQGVDQKHRNDIADMINEKQQAYADEVTRAHNAGIDVTKYEQQAADMRSHINSSIEKAKETVAETNANRMTQMQGEDGLEFLQIDAPTPQG